MKSYLSFKRFLKAQSQDQKGMALLMVMSSIAILTYLLADFTFETKVHQIKAYNAQDRAQARLTAEAGVAFSLGKLRIYQEVRNRLEKNKNLKQMIPDGQIESVLSLPFIFPIPMGEKASNIQKNALQEFEAGTVLKGNLNVTMTQITGFLNPNLLRLPVPDPNNPNQARDQGRDRDQDRDGEGNDKTPAQIIEEKLLAMLTEEIRLKREQDNLFDQLYATLDPRLLVKELKYYVNNPEALNDPEIPEIQAIYNEAGLQARHAPMTSLDELYTLAGWPEVVVNMVKDRMTVHEVGVISLNQMTENTLRLIFPEITPLQIEEFFNYRDGDPDLGEPPRPFQSVDEFKNLILRLNIAQENQYNQRVTEFKAAGLEFGVVGQLYKVISTARYNTASVTVTAFIELPAKPQPPPPPQAPGGQNPPPRDDQDPDGDQPPPGQQPRTGQPPGQGQPQELPLELMLPRIVEYRID